MELTTSARFGDAGYEPVEQWRIVGDVNNDDLAAAERVLSDSMARCSFQAATGELLKLRSKTKSRAQTSEDLEAWFASLAEELTAYPIDIVKAACHDWSEVNTWTPGWAELRELCERHMARRRKMLDAIQRARRGQPALPDHLSGDPRPSMTDEQKREGATMLRQAAESLRAR